nr:hypothetical protein L203_04448 [Cryptococcus depauperatus CBS 7841]
MSISFNEPDLQPTYQAIIDGLADYDWALFNQTGNELKVQATGNGLEELEEEFMDGRIQYAFARVKNPNSNLPKFVLISWCGDGVPEFRKGLYFTHSAQVQNNFLKGAHLVIQARSELDVTPSHIHKRIQESSGSKYSSAPAPVRPAPASKSTPSYRPGQGLGGSQGKPVATPTPSNFTRPTPAPAPVATFPPPVNQASRPMASANIDTTSYPAVPEPSKPTPEDRIASVGTNYQPIKLQPGKLQNRWNPSASEEPEEAPIQGLSVKDRMSAFSNINKASDNTPKPTSKKLTWAERQAEAKRLREEEDRASAAASANIVSSMKGVSPVATGTPTGVSSTATGFGRSVPPPPAPTHPSIPDVQSGPVASTPPPAITTSLPPRPPSVESDEDRDDDDWDAPPPPPPPAPFRPTPVQAKPDEPSEATAPPPPPPPPPPPLPVAPSDPASFPQVAELERLKQDLTLSEAPPAGPPPIPEDSRPRAGPPAPVFESTPAPMAVPQPMLEVAGKKAKVLFEYEAAEDNEISLKEDEVITQIEELDEGWWSGVNSIGQSGLFPANYVEVISDGGEMPLVPAPVPPPTPPPIEPVAHNQAQIESASVPPPPPPPPPATVSTVATEGLVMLAAYDYEAGEDNEISFREGDRIIQIEKVDPDWWQGICNGKEGLFPAAYVVRPEEYPLDG